MDGEKGKRSSGVYCVAKSCSTKKGKKKEGGVPFHHFPLHDLPRCQRWIEESRMTKEPNVNDMICGNHFKNNDYKSDKCFFLKDDAVPSVFEWNRKTQGMKIIPNDEKPESEKKRNFSPTKDELNPQVDQKQVTSLALWPTLYNF